MNTRRGKSYAAAVRGHWSIESQLHWQLDVSFHEDACRVKRYQDTVRIPMTHGGDSLNVAAASAVAFYQLALCSVPSRDGGGCYWLYALEFYVSRAFYITANIRAAVCDRE